MGRGAPLIYLYGVTPGRYMPVWPVYIVRDHPAELSFSVAVDALTQRRLHRQGFRERVLRAYQEQCAICRLRHDELLDAAHILPDGHPKGEPIVPNALALCAPTSRVLWPPSEFLAERYEDFRRAS